MQPSTHAADAVDDLDPWGLGATAADEVVAIEAADRPIDTAAADMVDDDGGHDVAGHGDRETSADDAIDTTPLQVSPHIEPVSLEPSTAASSVGPQMLLVRHATRAPWPRLAAAPPAPPEADAPATGGVSLVEAVRRGVLSPRTAALVGVLALAVMGQAFYIGLSLSGEVRANAVPTGEVVLSSHPAGAQVTIDGRPAGVTPLVATLPVGPHRVEVAGVDVPPQALEAVVEAGGRWTRHVALASVAAVPADGALRVDTASAGAAVWLDGVQVGRSPLTVPGLAPGRHTVRVHVAGGVVERRIDVTAGETVSLVLDAPAARAAVPTGPASGWVRVETSFDVQIVEDGQLVGSSASDRIMVTAGPHVFELVNAALGFRATMKVVVGAGRTEPLVVDTPRAAVQVNAQPWAEVMVDGRVLGETPLANLSLPIGVHQFVFRHPELGERAQAVTVRLDGPNRVTADLRR